MEPERYPGCLAWITEEFKELRLAGINMVSSMEELYRTDFANYCALFLGGGNTYRLLAGLKASGCFEKIADYIRHDGVVFGGSAGAILFGADIDSCACDDNNGTDLTDTAGFDVLNGLSLLCHYTNRSAKRTGRAQSIFWPSQSREPSLRCQRKTRFASTGQKSK